MNGDPFKAVVTSSDASSGVAVPIYLAGQTATYTVNSKDFIEVTDIEITTVPGGPCHVFIGADATPAVPETIVKGTYAANGGIATNLNQSRCGVQGGTIWVIAPAGTVDVVISGRIHR